MPLCKKIHRERLDVGLVHISGRVQSISFSLKTRIFEWDSRYNMTGNNLWGYTSFLQDPCLLCAVKNPHTHTAVR